MLRTTIMTMALLWIGLGSMGCRSTNSQGNLHQVVPGAVTGDHFLIFGGGYLPTGNQISLEKNVEYFQRLLADRTPAVQHLLFADGDAPGRDLQYTVPEYEPPPLLRALAELNGSTKGMNNRYRSNHLSNIDGPCTQAAIDQYFDTIPPSLHPGDRLICYFTGHGGRGEKQADHNTKLHLWNREDLRMRDFVARLDKVPAEIPVALVMVQCYSGGFQHVIFKNGDPAKGLSDNPRCGFFSTVHNRVAAGCTPDIDEASYQDYSTYFWAALAGVDRLGKKIPAPDYDGDGQVSMDEAHAFVILHSNSIDIPTKTSDGLLDYYSKARPDPPKKEDAGKKPDATPESTALPKNLITVDTDFPALRDQASPIERAILAGLTQKLALPEVNALAAAHTRADDLEKRRTELVKERQKKLEEFRTHQSQLQNALDLRWPELRTPWHPDLSQILKRDGDDIIIAIERNPEYKILEGLAKEMNDMDSQRFTLEREWVLCQRLILTADNLARAANLAALADETIVRRYQALRKLEHGTLKMGPESKVQSPKS